MAAFDSHEKVLSAWKIATSPRLPSGVHHVASITAAASLAASGAPPSSTSAYHDDAQKVQREVIEKDFLTEALSFAVGWGYIVSLRDVSYLLGRVLGRDSEGWTRMAQILIVLLVGTTLTLLLMLLVELPSLIGRRLLSRRGGSLTPAEGLRESLANPDAS